MAVDMNLEFTLCKYLQNVYILSCHTLNKTKNVNELYRKGSTRWKSLGDPSVSLTASPKETEALGKRMNVPMK